MHNGRSRLLRLCLVWLLCWGFTHSLQAQPADLRVEARSYIFDPESEIYRFFRVAVLTTFLPLSSPRRPTFSY